MARLNGILTKLQGSVGSFTCKRVRDASIYASKKYRSSLPQFGIK